MSRTVLARSLALIALTIPLVASAQHQTVSPLSLAIPGFSVVAPEGGSDHWLQTGTETGPAASEDVVRYETNRDDQSVFVHVEGDLTGLEVLVEPLTETTRVIGMGSSGSTGAAETVSFRTPGSAQMVTGVRSAGAELGVRYRLVALDATALARPRNIRVYYTIN